MLFNVDFLPENQSIVPFSKDYQDGDSEPDHSHNCAQLIHSLSGVVQVNTHVGSWVAPRPWRLVTGQSGT